MLGHNTQSERLVLMEQWKTLQKRTLESQVERRGSPPKHSCWSQGPAIDEPSSL